MCKDGYLAFTGKKKKGIVNLLYFHQCSKCDKMFELKKQYPAIKFEDVPLKESEKN